MKTTLIGRRFKRIERRRFALATRR